MRHRLLRRGIVRSGAVGAAFAAVLVVGAGVAGGWSPTPGSGLPGAAVRLTSSPSEPCVWDETLPDGSAVTRYDGVRVEIHLAGQSIGAVPVAPGGAWAGTLRVPDLPSGTYPLTARCIVQDPALPGGRTVDFDPRTFDVSEAPPPVTATTAPPVVVPPPVVVDAAPARPASVRSGPGTLPNTGPGPSTLPNTGDGTLAVALAGVGALGIGGGAVWWGGRKRPVPTEGPPSGLG